MKDRRKLTRYDIEDYFTVIDRNTKKIIGGLANLSIEGVKLITTEPVKKHSVLRCTVNIPKVVLGRDSLGFDAECRWCKQNKRSGWYESGYKITNISMPDQTTIMCLVLQMITDKVSTQTTIEVP